MGVVIASVPAGHVYVRHLDAPGGSDNLVRLDDPLVAGAPAAQWWPPPMLQAEWVRAHASDFDLMHIHFGFDDQSPDTLRLLVDALREHRKPLVLTVHDLRNPHHREPDLHDAQLGVLVRAADTVITITPGAAAEIGRRWSRRVHVLPHPHVVDEPTLSRDRPRHEGFVVAVHVKSLRANMDPLPVIEQIADDLSVTPGASLRVDAHYDVMADSSPPHVQLIAARLTQMASAGLLDLHVHDYFTDEELWEYLLSIDVSVLPYRFGTHSGWLEACFDLGTTVLAPDCGYYVQQRPCAVYAVPGSQAASPDVPSLTAALRRVYEERPDWRAAPSARLAERCELAEAHATIYAEALRGSAACTL